MEALERRCYDAAVLMRDHPPCFKQVHKQKIYEMIISSSYAFEGAVDYARWATLPLPDQLEDEGTMQVHPGVFAYGPAEMSGKVAWHMNFADPYLFCAYGSSLMAQDELQVAEHPTLGALREALQAEGVSPTTVAEDGSPTPVTLAGVQRRCAIDTMPNPGAGRPRGIYGNAFAAAPEADVMAATQLIEPPTVSHILAMAAPACGYGRYNAEEISEVVQTAYTGYRAAKSETARLYPEAQECVIHTGFWGCGAFGGNRGLMTMLQYLAADCAGVALVFWAFDEDGVAQVESAARDYQEMCQTTKQVAELLARIDVMGFEWGVSDGN